MEDWEKELRERLDKEIPHGIYKIGAGRMTAWTGKAGRIEYEVALQKHCKNLITVPIKNSRCCGRCDGVNDLCVSDTRCIPHQTLGCEKCWPHPEEPVYKSKVADLKKYSGELTEARLEEFLKDLYAGSEKE